MAAHRKPRQRSLRGPTARTAATVALAGAATAATTATGLDGTAHADPQLSLSEVKAEVDKLYEEAEVATEKYNGAEEKAGAAERRLNDLRDEAARRADRYNAAREALGALAAAQYRSGGAAPAMQLALSDDPERYLEGAAFAERAGDRQASAVGRARTQLRELERLRGAARVELTTLKSRQTELNRHKKTITGKLGEARRLLSRLTAEQRARLAADEGGSGGEGGERSSRTDAGRPGAGPPASGSGPAAGPAAGSPTGSAAGQPSSQAPGFRAAAAIAYARQALGSPYVWGATGPDAFDCSGLVQAAYRSAGVSLPRTTYAQIDAGHRVARSELAPGDLVFFYSGISHVGIYIGNGQMIHAPNPSAPVRVAPIDEMPFAGAARVA
ncbi:NlpC/P60 family protein [Streptomyces sp. NPDC059786]|uniref:C40 family peptidase n=1 Tax=Streptomyces sp. NPDC059786 TaxID=3346946 RepID=UPI00366338AF